MAGPDLARRAEWCQQSGSVLRPMSRYAVKKLGRQSWRAVPKLPEGVGTQPGPTENVPKSSFQVEEVTIDLRHH